MSRATVAVQEQKPFDTVTRTRLPEEPTALEKLHTGRRAPVLAVAGLTVQYGEVVTVRNVDLELHEGETVALVGGSGTGKSTIAKAVAGLVTPTGGSVHLHISGGEKLELLTAPPAARRAAKRSIHLVMQDPYASLPPPSPHP